MIVIVTVIVVCAGLVEDPQEGERVACALGNDTTAMFMRNHGVIVKAPTVAEAWDELYYLERACMNQVTSTPCLPCNTGSPRFPSVVRETWSCSGVHGKPGDPPRPPYHNEHGGFTTFDLLLSFLFLFLFLLHFSLKEPPAGRVVVGGCSAGGGVGSGVFRWAQGGRKLACFQQAGGPQ